MVGNLPFLLSDTVGFIRKLPTQLIESFKSTLDETRESDFLIHVIDISHPQFEDQLNVVDKTLNEIGSDDKPTLLLFNKIDQIEEEGVLNGLQERFENDGRDVFFMSALHKDDVIRLRNELYLRVKELHAKRYPYNQFLY